ncbi:plasmid segregation oscillating ATPase ParF [Shewanella psychrophila]|uniref:Plasmid segregation oscillating ATPase ParF n=1 Tax=Shewanella psychrophila TaxID=225848 RepID=A0A1S6HWL6_9GAMM|nr:ParA family protein [Shewanella psychrophila]AQS39824.1 plasmid segregation oscillating ATPase ParF [Shewanella psychrophila]
MTILLIGAQKGGVGKSTIAASVAVKLAHMNKDVCIVDADKQQSLSKWHQYRSEINDIPRVNCVSATGNITATLKDLNERYDVLIVDVAGRDSIEMRSAMIIADVLISPLRPSQADLDTVPHLLEIFEQASIMNPKLKGFLVQNMCPTLPSVKDADKAAEVLGDTKLMKLSEIRLCDRKGHRDGFGYGYGVEEWKKETGKNSDAKAAEEISWLISEVLENA